MTDETEDGESRADAVGQDRVAALAREYERAGRPFARVTVVRREPPVSANVGDRALVTPDGDLTGWIGGAACAQSIAVREATAALDDGEPRLIGLAPDPDDVDRPGIESYPMTCHSGGTLELFVEPVTPTPELVVVGTSPIGEALCELADSLGYDVTAVREEGDDTGRGVDRTVAPTDGPSVAESIADAQYVVVASMGAYDDVGVEAGLRTGAEYVGLVASDERRDELASSVADRLGTDRETVVEAITTPAGIDIGAKTGGEIAVSILAELVALRRDAEGAVDVTAADAAADWSSDDVSTGASEERSEGASESDPETAVDPVCGMDVTIGEATATVEHGGETYHFCGQGCADAFADDPSEYVEVIAGE